MAKKKIFTTFEAGQYANVNPYTIRHWIQEGILRAYTTPGGHRRIRREDLDAFLKEHQMPLPLDFSEGNKRVLLVDSDEEVRSGLADFIESLSENFDVRTAADPFTGACEIFTRDPHLLLLSLETPNFDGPDALRRLKSFPETSHLKAVALTEDPTVETLQRVQEAGFLECLVKPVDRGELRKILKEVFPYIPLRRPKKE